MNNVIASCVIALAGIASLTTMQLYALSQGINGTLFIMSAATVAAIVAGYCGFKVRDVWERWRDK